MSVKGGISRKPMVRPVIAIVLAVITLIAFRHEIAFLFAQEPKVVSEVTENFNFGIVSKSEAITNKGFIPGSKGWYLLPHSRGSLVYRPSSSVSPRGAAFIYLFFYKASPEVSNTMKLSLDSGATYVPVIQNVYLLGSRIDLTPFILNGGTFELLFEAENGSSSPVLVLDRMDLRIFETRPPEPPSLLRMTLAFFSLGLAFVLFTHKWKQSLPILGIMGLGFLFRYLNLTRVIYSSLDPDAQGYKLYADKLVPFTDTGFYSAQFSMREPFFLLVAKGFFQIFGSSDTHLRLLSLFLSLLVIYLVYRIAREVFGQSWGLLAAPGIALNIPLIVESGRGLRLELEMALILLFCYIGFIIKGIGHFPRFIFLGVIGGLIVLTRSAYLPGMGLLAIAVAAYHRKGIKGVTLASFISIFIMVILFAPHQYSIYRRHGDLFWDTNTHARWFANMEFAGQPGFPSREEIERNAYTGPRLTYGEYLFKLHTPREVIAGTFRGLYKIASHMDVIGYHKPVAGPVGFNLGWMDQILKLLGGIGVFLALLLPGYRWLPLGFFALVFPVAFMYDRGLTEQYRLTMQAFPFFLFCAILVTRRVSWWAWDKIRAGSSPS